MKISKKQLIRGIIKGATVMTITTSNLCVGALEAGGYQLPDLNQIHTASAKLTVQALIQALPKEAQLSDPLLILVNKKNRYKQEQVPTIVWGEDGRLYGQPMVEALNDWMLAAQAAGFSYHIVSSHRSVEEQEANRRASIADYLAQGLSQAEAEDLTDQYYAPADASEHTTGLAIDLLGNEWLNTGGELTADYSQTASARWLAANAHHYGFILRYMQGKEAITGYQFEPWHFRYVGKEHAAFIYQYGLTLEEYLALLASR